MEEWRVSGCIFKIKTIYFLITVHKGADFEYMQAI